MQPSQPSRVLYLDCVSGVSGDMLLGALVDLGLDIATLRSRLASLPLSGYSVTSRKVTRAHFGARKVTVKTTARHGHRGLAEIRSIIRRSGLEEAAKRESMEIFERIIKVEAAIHRIPERKVHLHEVGAVDAIIDVVGAVTGLREILEGGRLVCSPLNVGHGSVRMDHGLLPVPAPATAALLKGVPVYSEGPPGELTTPTGAAIVTSLADSFGPPPPMTIERIGYGAGTRDIEGHPNVLRAMLGSPWPAASGEGSVSVIECTIDDMNPQGYGYLMERLFDAGAYEVFYTPVHMKKGRPGIQVSIICGPDRTHHLARIVFEETTTIGLRTRSEARIELHRETTTVAIPFGRVRVKVSYLDGRVVQAQPEYEDCARLAARRGVPLKEIQIAALSAYGKNPG